MFLLGVVARATRVYFDINRHDRSRLFVIQQLWQLSRFSRKTPQDALNTLVIRCGFMLVLLIGLTTRVGSPLGAHGSVRSRAGVRLNQRSDSRIRISLSDREVTCEVCGVSLDWLCPCVLDSPSQFRRQAPQDGFITIAEGHNSSVFALFGNHCRSGSFIMSARPASVWRNCRCDRFKW